MQVTVIKDSVSPQGIRLTTLHLRYWRPIHSELMTHRVFSRNARSSRAVPVVTLLSEGKFVPQFGLNQRGMQAKDEQLPPELQAKWEREWDELAELCRAYVRNWGEEGMHKQWANRPLEWFGWIDVLVTSTDWANFYALRLDKAAQPELRMLAEEMHLQMRVSTPTLLNPGEWHLPWISPSDVIEHDLETQIKLSVARCARLSYKPFDGNGDLASELKRYESLVVSRPVHASPAEHQATPDQAYDSGRTQVWKNEHLWGNFRGWVQHRKMLANEAVSD